MIKSLIWLFATICSCKCFLAAPHDPPVPRALRKRSHESYTACASAQQLEVFQAQFYDSVDKNQDGKATFDEVKDYLAKYSPVIKDSEVEKFIARRDVNANGVIDFVPDYVTEVLSPSYGRNKAKEWFQLEDSNRDGVVSRSELIAIATNIGMSPKEAAETVDLFYMAGDQDGDGRLNWKEYSSVVM
ncbi:uncharacterized protein LOC111100809 [Crassostrea virginica]